MLEASEVDRSLSRAAWFALIVWLGLIALIYQIPTVYNANASSTTTSPEESAQPLDSVVFSATGSWETLKGTEQRVCIIASLLLSVLAIQAHGSSIFFGTTNKEMIPHENIKGNGQVFFQRRWKSPSGIMVAAYLVMLISIATNVHLAFWKTPVYIDPVTGIRIFALRYCEWISLSGLITFMAEAVDLKAGNIWPAIFCGLSQSISTACGLLFPLCRDKFSWAATFLFSTAAYSQIFVREASKRKELSKMNVGTTVRENECYNRHYLAHKLVLMCATVWTYLVVFFTLNASAHYFLPEGHVFRQESFSILVDTSFDVLAKGLYLDVIVKLHQKVFDRDSRIERQYRQLRNLMGVLWDSTTDVILVSVQGHCRTTSLVSPSFQTLVDEETKRNLSSHHVNGEEKKAERQIPASPPSTEKESGSGMLLYTTDYVNTSNSSHKDDDDDDAPSLLEVVGASTVDEHFLSSRANGEVIGNLTPLDHKDYKVQLARDMIQTCWENLNVQVKDPAGPLHSINGTGFDTNKTNQSNGAESLVLVYEMPLRNLQTCSCEIKISRRTSDSFVAIVRNVSERTRLFEAEKRAAAEAQARQRDAHNVNRFTRHEVKNSLLAGIELCEELRGSFHSSANSVETDLARAMTNLEEYKAIESGMNKTQGMIGQVDRVLHEVLETILAESMARDVINEAYEPSLRAVDPSEILSSLPTNPRFSLVVDRDQDKPFSKLLLDSRLLFFVHRNAISNAIKYGRNAGLVSTHLQYDRRDQQLTVKVVNEPGPGHERLLAMGPDGALAVFRQSTRLHSHSSEVSAGDGAWIMQKCARSMRGSCSIAFEKERTVFTLQCHAPPAPTPPEEYNGPTDNPELAKMSPFQLPDNTWAVGIDDSLIQRKILNRILKSAGIDKQRRRVLGQNKEELDKVSDLMKAMLDEDPTSRILMLVDENLTYPDGRQNGVKSISGSAHMQHVLNSMCPSKRNRVVVLIRSANDSSEDRKLYSQRAHGFFAKSTTNPDDVLETLEENWTKRFGLDAASKTSAMELLRNDDCEFKEGEDGTVSSDDLRSVVLRVDELLALEGHERKIKWEHLWSSLHALKGDIMISDDVLMVQAAAAINAMRGPTFPSDFQKRWKHIRKDIMEALDQTPRM